MAFTWVTTSSSVSGSSPSGCEYTSTPFWYAMMVGAPADVGSGRQALLGLDIDCAVDDVGMLVRRLKRRREPAADLGRKVTETDENHLVADDYLIEVRFSQGLGGHSIPSCRCADAPPCTSIILHLPERPAMINPDLK
jgi:hypothetical protein